MNFQSLKDYFLLGLQEAPGHVHAGKPCGGPMCMSHLCAPPIIPQTVYSSIVQVLFQCIPSNKILSDTIFPGIKTSGLWDSLDRNQVNISFTKNIISQFFIEI